MKPSLRDLKCRTTSDWCQLNVEDDCRWSEKQPGSTSRNSFKTPEKGNFLTLSLAELPCNKQWSWIWSLHYGTLVYQQTKGPRAPYIWWLKTGDQPSHEEIWSSGGQDDQVFNYNKEPLYQIQSSKNRIGRDLNSHAYARVGLASIFERETGRTIVVDLLSAQSQYVSRIYSSQHWAGTEMDGSNCEFYATWQTTRR